MPRLGCEPIPAGTVVPVGTASDGDLLYYNAGAWQLLPPGADGEFLSLAAGLPTWDALPPSPVLSVFGRSGAVVAQTGDYTASQVGAISSGTLTTNGDTIYYALGAYQRLAIGAPGDVLTVSGGGIPSWAAPASAVTSVFGRTGAVTAQSGDYTAAQVGAISDTLMTTNYDLITRIGGVNSRFGLGSANQVLAVNGAGTTFAWTDISSLTGTYVTAASAFTNDERILRSDGTGRGAQASAATLTDAGVLSGATWQGATIGIAYGGTGATTSQGAINAISQMTTAGDIIYYNGTNVVRLAIGAAGTLLTSTGTAPAWSLPASYAFDLNAYFPTRASYGAVRTGIYDSLTTWGYGAAGGYTRGGPTGATYDESTYQIPVVQVVMGATTNTFYPNFSTGISGTEIRKYRARQLFALSIGSTATCNGGVGFITSDASLTGGIASVVAAFRIVSVGGTLYACASDGTNTTATNLGTGPVGNVLYCGEIYFSSDGATMYANYYSFSCSTGYTLVYSTTLTQYFSTATSFHWAAGGADSAAGGHAFVAGDHDQYKAYDN